MLLFVVPVLCHPLEQNPSAKTTNISLSSKCVWRCCLVVYVCWPHAEWKPSCRAINISFFSKCAVSRRSLPILYLSVCHPLRGKSRYYAQRFDCVLNCPAVASFGGSISINTYFPRLSAAFKARKAIIRFVLGIFAHTLAIIYTVTLAAG